ncbi:uncharacterized protein LOC141535878 [Cotesia typhae]|uniref:uncharacterized protein LOC141535878 n=1 Tax=Cotesia typhae TaxID=2053667 RepID=UPI003D6876E5
MSLASLIITIAIKRILRNFPYRLLDKNLRACEIIELKKINSTTILKDIREELEDPQLLLRIPKIKNPSALESSTSEDEEVDLTKIKRRRKRDLSELTAEDIGDVEGDDHNLHDGNDITIIIKMGKGKFSLAKENKNPILAAKKVTFDVTPGTSKVNETLLRRGKLNCCRITSKTS